MSSADGKEPEGVGIVGYIDSAEVGYRTCERIACIIRQETNADTLYLRREGRGRWYRGLFS